MITTQFGGQIEITAFDSKIQKVTYRHAGSRQEIRRKLEEIQATGGQAEIDAALQSIRTKNDTQSQ